MLKTVDLFSGCGGMSLGFIEAGFDIVVAYENWLPAINVYKQNFSHDVFSADLSNEDVIPQIQNISPSMIIGGPPCQDFSSAGKRDESMGRADLTLSFAKIISNTKPEWFVMENVDRITKSKALKESLFIYKQAGYGISTKVLNAAYCGVPQTGKRFFMIGHLNSPDNFLDEYLDSNLSNNPMTVEDYLGNTLGIQYYYRHPRSYKRRGVFSIKEPSPTIRGVNRPVPKGYKKHSGDPCEIDLNVRPLTTIERGYIQTFPPHFKFQGNKTDLEQMIGNAVPVNMAKYLANCIADYIRQSSNKNLNSVKKGQLLFDYA
jgi:DNA (cytosine-5)-methyltransferase 1